MLNNNPVCITRCPAFTAIRTIACSRWGVAEEISFQLHKATREKGMLRYAPVIKPWSSYPRSNQGRPLSAEEVDGEFLLGEGLI